MNPFKKQSMIFLKAKHDHDRLNLNDVNPFNTKIGQSNFPGVFLNFSFDFTMNESDLLKKIICAQFMINPKINL